MSIETRQLRYFIAVAEEKHFGRAAERLMMAQPPLSQQIKQFEASLGTTLFIRSTRSVELTPAGELLLARGRRIMDELESIETTLTRVGQGLEGILRIGFTGTATYGFMPRVVRQSAEEYPGLALEVSGEKLTPSLIAGLENNHIDIALLRPPFSSPNIAHSVVMTERLVAAIPAGSALATRGELFMSDLANEEFIVYPSNSSVSQAVSASWLKRDVRPFHKQTVSETSTLLSLVAAGVGIALVPESATSIHIGGTHFITIRDAPSVELALAWRKNEASPAVRNFLPFLEGLIKTPLESAA
jgi:DNA-binding transcriptional LysR family regulator